MKVYDQNLASGVVPKGLRLKKSACVGEVSAHFILDWSEVLKKAELDLVRLLYNEVRCKRGRLLERYESTWSALESGEDKQFKVSLQRDIEEGGVRLKRISEEGRLRKLQNLRRNEGRTPRLSNGVITNLRTVLEEDEKCVG